MLVAFAVALIALLLFEHRGCDQVPAGLIVEVYRRDSSEEVVGLGMVE